MDRMARMRLASAQVVADVVGDEVVIVNLDNGAYYSTEGAGCDVWRLLTAGTAVEKTATILAERYAGDEATMASYLDQLVDELLEEGLLAVSKNDEAEAPEVTVELAETTNGATFVAAPLEKFSDMIPLLLLDPVHEVDDAGWPHAAGD